MKRKDLAVFGFFVFCASQQSGMAPVEDANFLPAPPERLPLAVGGPLLRALCAGFAGAAKYRVAIDVKACTL